jgi:hypothetical protein
MVSTFVEPLNQYFAPRKVEGGAAGGGVSVAPADELFEVFFRLLFGDVGIHEVIANIKVNIKIKLLLIRDFLPLSFQMGHYQFSNRSFAHVFLI